MRKALQTFEAKKILLRKHYKSLYSMKNNQKWFLKSAKNAQIDIQKGGGKWNKSCFRFRFFHEIKAGNSRIQEKISLTFYWRFFQS